MIPMVATTVTPMILLHPHVAALIGIHFLALFPSFPVFASHLSVGLFPPLSSLIRLITLATDKVYRRIKRKSERLRLASIIDG